MKTTQTHEAVSSALVIAVLVLAPFAGGSHGLVGTALLSILAIMSAIVLLWSRQMVRPVAFLPMVLFVALLAASAIVTESLHATILQTLYFAGCACSAVVASSVFRGERRLLAILAVPAVGLILGVIGVREYLMQGGSWRVFATFLNPGFYGAWLVMAIPVTLAVFLAARSPVVMLLAGLAWLMECLSLMLTGTRLAIYSAAIVVLLMMGLGIWTRGINRSKIARICLAVVVAVVVVFAARTPTSTRIKGPAAAAQSHSGPFRVVTWKGTLNIVRANPVLGTGAGTFDLSFARYRIAGPAKMAHNSYLQIASEAGIPALAAGTVAFITLFLAGIKGLARRESEDSRYLLPRGDLLLGSAVIAALVGALARNLFDSDIYVAGVGFPFWILAGIAAAMLSGRPIISPHQAVRVAFTALLSIAAVVLWLVSIGQTRYDAAEGALFRGEWMSAIEGYRSVVSIDPLRADAWLRLGQLEASNAANDKEFNVGLDKLGNAIDLEPTRAKHYITLGNVLASSGKNEEAVRQYKRALIVDPHATPAMLAAARLLDGSEADDMYRRMLKEENSLSETLKGVPEAVNPDFAWAHFHFGEKYLREGRRKEAAREFRAVIDRLERRKSYAMHLEAMREIGMVNPEEEESLEKLLADAKSRLRAVEGSQ